jgi:hypothetical protein
VPAKNAFHVFLPSLNPGSHRSTSGLYAVTTMQLPVSASHSYDSSASRAIDADGRRPSPASRGLFQVAPLAQRIKRKG